MGKLTQAHHKAALEALEGTGELRVQTRGMRAERIAKAIAEAEERGRAAERADLAELVKRESFTYHPGGADVVYADDILSRLEVDGPTIERSRPKVPSE